MPDSIRTRRDLIEKALEVLLEESTRDVTLCYQLGNGDTLQTELRREKAESQQSSQKSR